MTSRWNRQQLSLLATIVIAIALFACASWRYVGFASAAVLINLIDDNSFLGIAAVGMTFVILSGGIDLSVGSVVGLTSILTAILIQKFHFSPLLVLPFVVLLGAGFGALMGTLIALFNLAPFLVTLAGMFFARGLAYTLSLDSIPINHPIFVAVSQSRLNVGFVSLPSMAILFVCVVAVAVYISTQTPFGRAIYAVGGNAISAKLMGLRVERYQICVYALSGFTASLAGVAYSFYTSSGNATAALGLELDAIAAVVIGGTLLSGGSGTVLGTLVGTLILGMIQTIITFESTLSSWWTKIVIGALLFFFVVLQKGLARWSHSTMKTLKGPDARSTAQRSTVGISLSLVFALVAVGFAATSQSARAAGVGGSVKTRTCPLGQFSGARIADGFFQLTGTHLKVGQTNQQIPELPDPAPPFFNSDGSVEIYGSAQYFIRYQNWAEFNRGGCFEIIPMRIVGDSGFPYSGIYTHPWDLRKFRIESRNKSAHDVLIGGAMSPTHGQLAPIWPQDNINRRIFFFHLNGSGEWMRDKFSVVENVFSGWSGHSYGGNLLQVDSPAANVIQTDAPGEIVFFYEKVSEVKDDSPYKTEMFAVPMNPSGFPKSSSAIKIFDLGINPYPSTWRVGSRTISSRTGNGYLVEGPRPIQINFKKRRIFLVGFSSGDFPTDSYHLNFMWSDNLLSPYKPLLSEDQKDLKDFGQEIKNTYGLSWVGRPSLYKTPTGGYQMLFHGVVKRILPDNNYTRWPKKYQLWEFFRCLFKVNVKITEGPKGEPVIQVL